MIDETTGRDVVEVDGEKRPVSGMLSDAVRNKNQGDSAHEFISGFVSGDTQGRWAGGTWIHTSYVIREIEPDVFLTRSGDIYRVASWRPEPQSA